MKRSFQLIKVALAFLCALVLTFNVVVNKALATGQFSQTCENITINGSTLSAECETRNGYYRTTSIKLDDYIGNLDGVLSWGDSNFSQTCQDIGLAQLLSSREFLLAAQCEKVDGITYSQSDISLDEHIANIDGTLEYE
ncbi:mannose-binding lectin [Coleofasciculus sp. G2-EDA-02]|uniref:mannose-binding lectin n=1 Tax=unclassified Coleofasciculus TaxID=2692782 RepID=UPI0032FD6599